MVVAGAWEDLFLPPVRMVGGWPSPSVVWLGLVGIGPPYLCGCGWVWVSQMQELRKPFVGLYGTGMREINFHD